MITIPPQTLKFKNRISFKQARSAVLIAFILGVLISLGQIYSDYKKENQEQGDTILQVLRTVEQTASQSAYNLDQEFAKEIINGLFEYKAIYEASILDDSGRELAYIQGTRGNGKFKEIIYLIFGSEKVYSLPLSIQPPPISFEDMGKVIKVGEIIVKADTYQMGIRFLNRAAIIFFSGILRNLVLATILVLFFYKTLTRPFMNIEEAMTHIDPEKPEQTRVQVPQGHEKDEFAYLVKAVNRLLDKIQENMHERIKKVAETERLKGEIDERKRKEEELKLIRDRLQKSNNEYSILLNDLKHTQAQLIQSEKMAALGEMVASIAHEVNTPLGIGVTGSTHLIHVASNVQSLYEEQQMTQEDFEGFLSNSMEVGRLIETNLRNAFNLIKSFKVMAVDQVTEAKRKFNVKEYIEETLSNLMPELKKTKHTINVICDDDLTINSYPGYFSQIITNVVMNAVYHAFDSIDAGIITIDISASDSSISLKFSDNGAGIPEEIQNRIFEPFYTTRREKGGSGLGLHIVYSLIVNKLNGIISCQSAPDKGTTFLMTIPLQRD